MKSIAKPTMIGSLITFVIGLFVAFFGVMVSVFTDGLIYDRIVTILIVLIIYGIISIVLGFMKPKNSWLYMLSLCMPGIILLSIYMAKEFNILYLLYIMLIFLVSFFGVRSGKSFKIKKKK
ncbi:MAG: hypothetical protein ACERLG_10390 [Sedimentibacter sp.]